MTKGVLKNKECKKTIYSKWYSFKLIKHCRIAEDHCEVRLMCCNR